MKNFKINAGVLPSNLIFHAENQDDLFIQVGQPCEIKIMILQIIQILSDILNDRLNPLILVGIK